MRKLITGILSTVVLSAMLCACGCEDGRLEPNNSKNPDTDNSPITDIMPDMTNTPMGQSDGMATSDGMQ